MKGNKTGISNPTNDQFKHVKNQGKEKTLFDTNEVFFCFFVQEKQ